MSNWLARPGKGAWHAAAMLLFGMAMCAAAGSADAAPKVHVVTIEGMRYMPETVEVNAGDTIMWSNKDAFPHTVTAVDRSFDSGSLGPERTWKWKALKKGTFPYLCTLHPTMKATLVVK
jgi:plastocyanin